MREEAVGVGVGGGVLLSDEAEVGRGMKEGEDRLRGEDEAALGGRLATAGLVFSATGAGALWGFCDMISF